jgi:plasmid stabilization system protein ParE
LTGRIRLTPLAQADIDAASAWYAEKRESVALVFQDAVTATLARIEANPLHAPEVVPSARRRPMRGWPYNIWYVTNPEGPLVFAVIHQRRHDSAALARKLML